MDVSFKCYLDVPAQDVKAELDVNLVIQMMAGTIGTLVTAFFGVAGVTITSVATVYGILCATTLVACLG